MAYYRSCEYCGSNLDPGERCGCQVEEKRQERIFAETVDENGNRQLMLAGWEEGGNEQISV